MTEELTLDNPYWDEVAHLVDATRDRIWGTFTVGDIRSMESFVSAYTLRQQLVPKYSWTISAPQTVKFVAGHCTGRVIDPMAGTGYWAYLLGQAGITVVASDLNPPQEDSTVNHWHSNATTWVPVLKADSVDAATMSTAADTLLLSWPPWDDPIATKTLSAFAGNRLIYIGEGAGGATGDDDFFDLLEKEWHEYAFDDPVQYPGLHDFITVFDRNLPLPGS